VIYVRPPPLLPYHQSESLAVDAEDFDFGVILQILAQLRNKDIHTTAGEVTIIMPDLLKRIRTGNCAVQVAAQQMQKLCFFWR